MKDLCGVCKNFRDIVWHEEGTRRPYCRDCLSQLPLSSDEWAFILLTAPWSPFVQDMDMTLEFGGTPVYPTWRVVMTSKAREDALDEQWYTENCLTPVTDSEEATRD